MLMMIEVVITANSLPGALLRLNRSSTYDVGTADFFHDPASWAHHNEIVFGRAPTRLAARDDVTPDDLRARDRRLPALRRHRGGTCLPFYVPALRWAHANDIIVGTSPTTVLHTAVGNMGCTAERTDQTASLVRMADAQQLSQAAFDRLKAEYDDLTTRGRIDIARKIEAARELGDLSENGDYHAAKEEQGKMEGRIMHLGRMIENAVIVEAEVGGDSVMAGAIVTIVFDGDDEDDAERYLVGSIEEQADDVTVVSPGSPMGAALLGAAVGDEVEYEAPTGAVLKVKVLAIA